jgi:chemotaxis protein MotA
MIGIIGIVMTFVMVFGGYVAAGGKFGVILHALPFEFTMIMGATIGAFLLANKGYVAKKTAGSLGKVFKGTKWKKTDYLDVLALLFTILKLARTKGLIALEPHIEKPEESEIFKKYPTILHDHFAVDFICDTIRLMSMNMDNPYQIEDLMKNILNKHHHEALNPAKALQIMADGLPAIGIVAAVLGVIKTMSSIDQPPAVLGGMIGGALVGTFLGVFMAYCFVGPMASKLNDIIEEEAQMYNLIRDVIVAHLHGNAPQVSVEVGRGNIPTTIQPSFAEMEESMQAVAIPA